MQEQPTQSQLSRSWRRWCRLAGASSLKPQLPLLALLLLLAGADKASAQTTYWSRTNGNWSSPDTWSTTSSGTPISTVSPVAGDTVNIRPHTVTVTGSAACATLLIGSGINNIVQQLTFAGPTPSLNVSGRLDVGTANRNTRPGNLTFTSDAIVTAGSVYLNRNLNQTTKSVLDMTAGGKLVTGSLGVEGTHTDPASAVWTPGNGTVELTAYNTLPTTVFTNFNNLTLRNGWTTLSTDITIVGNLEIDASAVLDLGTFANSTTTLSFGGVQQAAGEWGATGSGAINTSDRFTGSGRMTVTGPALPGFAVEPVSQTVLEGQPVAFSVVVTGTPPLFVQWQRNGNDIAGANSPTYIIPSASPADDGAFFRAVVSNELAQVISSNAILTVLVQAAPTIVLPPSSASKYPAETVQFTVVAQGTPPMYYQWRKAGVNLTDSGNLFGASTTNLTITNIVAGNAGNYDVVVNNSIGSVTSILAVLTVLPTGPAQTLTLDYGGVPIVQGVGLDWNTVANWSDGKAASESALTNPGSTYKVVPGSLLRTPNGAADATFPGAALMVEGDGVYANGGTPTIGEIRLKQGMEGIVRFKKLVMNGGQLNTGNPGNVTIAGGEVNILANSVLYNDSDSDRGYRIDSWLSGVVAVHSFPSGEPESSSHYFQR